MLRSARRACLGVAMIATLACTGEALEAPSTPPLSPTPPAVAERSRPSPAPVGSAALEPPCGVDRLTIAGLPSHGAFTWNPPSDVLAIGRGGPTIPVLRSDTRRGQFHRLTLSADAASDVQSVAVAAARLGELGELDLDLEPARGHYAADVFVGEREAEIVVGLVDDPGRAFVVDADPLLDGDPRVVEAHGGGWAVAWARGKYPFTPDIHFAQVDPDGRTRGAITLEVDAEPEGLDIVRTRTGYLVVYTRTSVANDPRLVAFVLDTSGKLARRVVVSEERTLWVRASVDPQGVGLAVALRRNALGFARLSPDGEVLTPLTRIHSDTMRLASVGRPSITFHRGQYWVAASTSYCHVHGCEDQAHAFLVAVTPDGTFGPTQSLGREGYHVVGPVVGPWGDDVLAAWYYGGASTALHLARVGCPG
ncbi:MAG: hypothetical protein H6711_02735 [Myxococcales bacterium]|nr:hypothetical protein [Myxococcales bacterium]